MRLHLTPVLLGFIFAGLLAAPSQAQSSYYDTIAENIVNQSLAVQPGEVIIINGGPTEVDLMAAIEVAVAKAGGESIVQLSIPEANKRMIMETPMEHLRRLPTAGLLMNRIADGFISVGSVQDPDLFADVPEERLSVARKSGLPLADAFATATVRTVALGQTGGIPTEAYAKTQGADYEEMASVFWESVGVSSETLAHDAKAIASYLKPGTAMKLTTTAGTDLSFKVADVAARINAGRTADVVQPSGSASVWLPAGEAYAAVDLHSASGTLVIPHLTFRGEAVHNLRVTFAGGTIASMTADSGVEKVKAYLDASDAPSKRLSVVDVGVNKESRPLEGSNYVSWEMAGMVTLMVGNNTWTGGDNNAESALPFHVAGATLTADGKVLVQNGELQGVSLSMNE